LLLDNSRRLGAEVLEDARVSDVTLDGGQGPRVTALNDDGTATEWSARFLVDATGRDTLLTSRLGLKRINKHNNTAAVFGHFRNVPRRSGDKEGMITVYLFEHG
jgi:flavin-dependent dehydrogenase